MAYMVRVKWNYYNRTTFWDGRMPTLHTAQCFFVLKQKI